MSLELSFCDITLTISELFIVYISKFRFTIIINIYLVLHHNVQGLIHTLCHYNAHFQMKTFT